MIKGPPLWSKLGIGARLFVLTAALLLTLGLANQYIVTLRLADDYRLDIGREGEASLDLLQAYIAEQAVTGNYAAIQKMMDTQARRPVVSEILWRDGHQRLLSAKNPSTAQVANVWFKSLISLSPPPHSRTIAAAGEGYGTVTVYLTAAPWENRLWSFFWKQALFHSVEIAVLLASIALVLRRTLRSLKSVNAVVRQFSKGDYGARIAFSPRMPPEIRDVVVALNQASDTLESHLAALTEQRSATDNAAIVAETNPDGTISFVNDKFCDISGYSREELLGANHRMLSSGIHSAGFFAGLYRTLAEAKVWHGEICNRRKNGSVFWTDTTITPIPGEGGKPAKYVMIRFDITALKEAQARIKLDYHKQRAVSEILQAALEPLPLDEGLEKVLDTLLAVPWEEKTPRGGIFLVDEAMPNTLTLMAQRGLSPLIQSVCANVPFGLCLCGQAAASRKIIASHNADPCYALPHGPIESDGVISVPIHSGGLLHGVFVLYLNPGHRFSAGDLDFLQTVAHTLAGVFERKSTEHVVQRLGRIIDDSLNEVYMFDAATLQFVQVNHGARLNLDYTMEELREKTPLDLCPAFSQEQFDALLEPLRSGEQRQAVFESSIQRKNASLYPVEMQLQLSRLSRGPVFFAMVQDITERKRAEADIARSHAQLRALSSHLQTVREEEKAHIAREIHDELGGLLTALNMDVFWLAKRTPPELAPLHEKLAAMTQLVSDAVQTTRRIATDLRPTLLDDIGLTAAIEWQVKEFQKRMGLNCQLTLPAMETPLNKDYSIALFRILQESLTNIARHAAADRVDISLEWGESGIVLAVSDNGCGIAQERILNPQSHGVRGIYERAIHLGGSVDISGVPGAGTRVTVTLPLPEEIEGHD